MDFSSIQYKIDDSCISFAHPLIINSFRTIFNLEKEFKASRPHTFANIERLIQKLGRLGAHVDTKTSNNIFRYFAASHVYTSAIMQNFNDQTATEAYMFTQTSVRSTDLYVLNTLAGNILNDLNQYTQPEHINSDNLSGMRSQITSAGSIPFMKVYVNEKVDLNLRRGFELSSCDPETLSRVANNMDDPLRTYAFQVMKYGSRIVESIDGVSLRGIVPDETYLNRILHNKFITWIRVFLGTKKNKVVLEIDFADHNVKRDPNKFCIDKESLNDVAGVSHYESTNEKNWNYSEEDLIVSFFSNQLFQSVTGKPWICQNLSENKGLCNHENTCTSCNTAKDLEAWSHNCLRNIVHSNREMYIGFCFKSIVDSGYSDSKVVNSSTNVLLIALTRGLVRLMSNYEKSILFLSRNITERPDQVEVKNCLHCIFFNANRERRPEEEVQYGRVQTNSYTRHRAFVGATSKAVTVKTGPPYPLLVLILVDLIIILSYAIPMGVRQSKLERQAWEEYASSLTAIISATIGLSLLLLKCFLRGWDISDMFHNRRKAVCMSELTHVMPKNDVIQIFSQLKSPDEVFSPWRSCAFTSEGKGEFEVDENISVRDLQKSKFVFGVDYYGYPIVADSLGRIRKLHFPDCSTREGNITENVLKSIEDENDNIPHELDDQILLHIGGLHEIQTRSIFRIPIANILVGSEEYNQV